MPKRSPPPSPKKRGRPKKILKGITQSEFAKRDGCSATHVARCVQIGSLQAYPDGSIDPALVGSDWRASNAKKNEQAANDARLAKMQTKLESDDDLDDEDNLVDEHGVSIGMTKLEAERLKITYDVLKRKREHDLEMGRVVLVEDVAKLVGKRESEIRTKLLAIPNGHSPQIHALKTVMEVQDYLQTIITQALQALSGA